MSLRGIVATILLSMLLAVGCAAGSTTKATPTNPDLVAATSAPTKAPTSSAQSREPQRVEFTAEDGTSLVGTFWPAPNTQQPVTGILLLHWNPGTRADWDMLAALLQGMAISNPSQGSGRYAVFAFDFRGHGESGGTQDRANYVQDTQAALRLFRTLSGVDSTRIIMIGASVGADAAVDACGEGCNGVISLSPGNFTGVKYADAVAAIGDKPVLCVAAEGDNGSPQACRDGQAAAQGQYELQIYKGSAHAMEMFNITEEEPALIDLIFEWLDKYAPAQKS